MPQFIAGVTHCRNELRHPSFVSDVWRKTQHLGSSDEAERKRDLCSPPTGLPPTPPNGKRPLSSPPTPSAQIMSFVFHPQIAQITQIFHAKSA
jgi:hypothetical protein